MERNGTMVKLWEENILSREVKRELYESVAIPMWYKDWILGRVRKSIKERCGRGVSVLERIERNVLKWFGYVERMGEERFVKRVYRANVEGKRGRERPQRRWGIEVKDLLIGRGLNEREGMVLARDKDAWSGMVYRLGQRVGVYILAFACVKGVHHHIC